MKNEGLNCLPLPLGGGCESQAALDEGGIGGVAT